MTALEEVARVLRRAAGSPDRQADLSGRGLTQLRLWSQDSVPAFVLGIHKLDLSNNKLSKLPNAVGDFANLRELSLQGNRLTGLPVGFEKLTSLTSLDFRNNKLRGFPASIPRLHSLQTLLLDSNPELADIPSQLSKGCPILSQLSIASCGIRPFPVSYLPALKAICLSQNKELVPELVRLGLLTGLVELALGGLDLHDSDLRWLERLPHLRRLDLRDNQLVSLPYFFADMQQLQELDVSITTLDCADLEIRLC